jgi:hypothetical protein
MERRTMIIIPNWRTMEQTISSKKTDYKMLKIERKAKMSIQKRRMLEQIIPSQNQTIKY